MDPAALERAITPRTKAIMPVHLFGQPADMDPILDIARRHRLVVIEDAAQAHGAEYKGRRVGSIGDIGCFSFYPGKNLGAYGEGGAAVTNNPQYADTMRLLRSWGEKTRYEHAIKGFNYRMDGIQGAILGVKLRHLEQWTEARRTRAALYRKNADGNRRADAEGAAGRAPRVSRLRRSPGAAGCVARASAAKWASRRACTIRFPCTCNPPIATSDTAPAIFPSLRRSPARCCRCRCFQK